MKKSLLLIICVMTLVSSALAQSEQGKRGLITTAACPYSCKDAGIEQSQCRESKSGDTCEVEDLSQPPGHRSLVRLNAASTMANTAAEQSSNTSNSAELSKTTRRGLVTSSVCPYNCRMARIPENSCRQWQEGDKCFVEDLNQPPGHRSRVSY